MTAVRLQINLNKYFNMAYDVLYFFERVNCLLLNAAKKYCQKNKTYDSCQIQNCLRTVKLK